MINNIYLYKILELEKDASDEEIKKNFKRLALKYHPDKNNNDSKYNIKFNEIRIAYEILSNKDKKEKYDNMINKKKKYFTKMISEIIKNITNENLLNKIINKIKIPANNDNIENFTKKIIKKLLNNIDSEIEINKLNEIFICSSINDSSNNVNSNTQYNTSELNTLNIIAKVKTNLEDVYYNKKKEIIVNKKIYKNNNIKIETNKYYIPLYDNEILIKNAGDKIINNNEIIIGDVILKIIYKNDNNIIKEDYDLIYNDVILHNDTNNKKFNKTITIFNKTFNINYNDFTHTDKNKIIIKINNNGFPKNNLNDRGNLIIKLNIHQ